MSHRAPESGGSLNASSQTLITVTEWPKREGYPSEAGLRWLIFHEKTNGFHKCVRRIGRRVLIDRDAFYAWVDEINGVGGQSNG